MEKAILSSLLSKNKTDVLKTFYEMQENEDNIITTAFEEQLKERQEKKKSKYRRFEEELGKHVIDDKERANLIELLEQYQDEYNNEHGLYYEQYYKAGIKAVIQLILQCLL